MEYHAPPDGNALQEYALTANATMDEFTGEFVAVGDEEVFFDCSVPPDNCFKLVPQMLQRQFGPLMRRGYAGKNPFKETAPYMELVTDMETCWELDRLGGSTGIGGTPSLSGNWRFTEFTAARGDDAGAERRRQPASAAEGSCRRSGPGRAGGGRAAG